MPTRVHGRWCLATAVVAGLVVGCQRDRLEPAGESSAAVVQSAMPSVCDATPLAASSELLRALPDRVASFCRDAHGRVRVLGDADEDLQAACTTLLAQDCRQLLRHGVVQIVQQRYVDERGGSESMVVTGFRFGRAEGAQASYGERLLGEEHPSRLRAVPLGTEASGAIVGVRGSFVRSAHVFEIVFASDRLTEEQRRSAAPPAIGALAGAIEAALPGEANVPESMKRLPEAERLPFGLRFVEGDVFGVEGAGPGAFGHYARAGRYYRLYLHQAGDEGVARDIERTLRRAPGAHRLEKMAFGAFELDVDARHGGGRWLIARLGSVVAGAGEDLFDVLEERAEVQERRRLSRLEKFRLVRDLLSTR